MADKTNKEETEDIDRYERIVDRAHKEIAGVRSVYKWYASIIGVILVTGIACVAVLTYRTVSDMRTDLDQRTELLANKIDARIEKEFEQPRIQATVQDAAAQQASTLVSTLIAPKVTAFDEHVAKQRKILDQQVAKTIELEKESRELKQKMVPLLTDIQRSLEQSQGAQKQLSTVKTNITEMLKLVATIQYYQMKGARQIPNPYGKEIQVALNKLVAIAISDPAERNKFIKKLQGTPKPKK